MCLIFLIKPECDKMYYLLSQQLYHDGVLIGGNLKFTQISSPNNAACYAIDTNEQLWKATNDILSQVHIGCPVVHVYSTDSNAYVAVLKNGYLYDSHAGVMPRDNIVKTCWCYHLTSDNRICDDHKNFARLDMPFKDIAIITHTTYALDFENQAHQLKCDLTLGKCIPGVEYFGHNAMYGNGIIWIDGGRKQIECPIDIKYVYWDSETETLSLLLPDNVIAEYNPDTKELTRGYKADILSGQIPVYTQSWTRAKSARKV